MYLNVKANATCARTCHLTVLQHRQCIQFTETSLILTQITAVDASMLGISLRVCIFMVGSMRTYIPSYSLSGTSDGCRSRIVANHAGPLYTRGACSLAVVRPVSMMVLAAYTTSMYVGEPCFSHFINSIFGQSP